MANTRSTQRHRRRFRVTVGSTPVFTLDVGPGGFAAEMMRALPVGTLVEGSIRLNGVEVGYAGMVVWARRGDPHMSLRGRIGVRFTRLPGEVRRLLDSSTLAHLV